MAEEVKIIIKGDDQASSKLRNVNNETKSLGETIKSVAIPAAAISAALTYAGISSATTAAEFNQLKGSFETTTKSMDISSEMLLSSLKDVSKGTISNKNLVLSANKAMALGVGKDVEGMTKLLEIARVKGQKMGLTTTQAFNDIVTGIGRGSPLILDNLGITIKLGEANEQYAKALGKSVDELTDAERKQSILNAVLVEGQRELDIVGSIAITDAESLQKLTATFDDMKQELGQFLLPILKKVVSVLTSLLNWFRNLDDGTKEIIVTVGIATAVFTGLIAALGLIITIAPGIAAAFTLMTGPIGIITLAVGALYIAWQQNFMGIQDITVDVWDNTLKPIFENIVNWLNVIIPPILEAFAKFWKENGERIMSIMNKTWEIVRGVFQLISAVIRKHIEIATGILEYFGLNWADVWDGIKTAAIIVWDILAVAFDVFFKTLEFTMSTIVDIMTGNWSGLWDKIKFIFEEISSIITGLWNSFWDGLADIVMGTVNSITGFVRGVVDYVSDAVQGLLEFLGLAEEKAIKVGSSAQRAAGQIAKPLAQPQTVGFANGGIITGGFQAFANGGVVNKPTLGLIGEGRNNEAVVPLPNGRSIPVEINGGGITININNPSIQNSGDIENLANRVGQVLARQLDLSRNRVAI